MPSFGTSDSRVHKTQKPCHFSVYSFQHIVKIRMDGINCNIIPDSQNNAALNIVVSCNTFQTPENNGMMGYDKIAFPCDCFLDHFLNRVQRA